MTPPAGTGTHSLLRDRVVLIAGGTAGPGAGIARAAAREGRSSRSPADAASRVRRWLPSSPRGTKALFVQADIGDAAGARGLRSRGARRLRGGPD